MPKQKAAIGRIHGRIAVNGVLSYAGFLSWVHNALCEKYKKK